MSTAAETALAEAEPPTPEPPPAMLEAPAPTPPRPEPAPREPSRRRFKPDPRLAIPLVILVLAAVGFLILRPDGANHEGGQQPGATSTGSNVSMGVPKTLKCPLDPNGWMKTEHGAERHYDCDRPPSAPKGLAGLDYGEFKTADDAHTQFNEGLGYHTDKGDKLCPAADRQRMREVFPAGRTACFTEPGRYLFLWWNGDSSRVWGSLSFSPTTKPATAVAEWENILKIA